MLKLQLWFVAGSTCLICPPSVVCSQESSRQFFPSRVAYAVRFYLEDIILPQWVVPQRSYMDFCFYSSLCLYNTLFCFSVDTGIPCRYLGFSLVLQQIRLGGCFACCDFLYPDWVVSWYLWSSASSAVPADLCFTALDLRRLVLQLVVPLEV